MFSMPSIPLSTLDVIRAAMRLFATSFMRALPYALVPVALLVALAGLGYVVAGEYGDRDWLLYLCAVLLLLCPALLSPLVHQVHAIAHARPATARESVMRGVCCFLPCLAAAAIFMLAVGAGAVLLLLPGLYLFIALSFWWLALVVDGLPAIEALKTSRRMVQGHWWHVVFGYSFIYAVAVSTNAFDVDTVSLPNEVAGAVAGTLLSVVVTALLPMFVSANMVVLYNDLALRRQRAGSR